MNYQQTPLLHITLISTTTNQALFLFDNSSTSGETKQFYISQKNTTTHYSNQQKIKSTNKKKLFQKQNQTKKKHTFAQNKTISYQQKPINIKQQNTAYLSSLFPFDR